MLCRFGIHFLVYPYGYEHWSDEELPLGEKIPAGPAAEVFGDSSVIDGDLNDPSSWSIVDPVFNDLPPARPADDGADLSHSRSRTTLLPPSSKIAVQGFLLQRTRHRQLLLLFISEKEQRRS